MSLDLSDVILTALAPDAPRRVGVAVSGGGDSMALLHAAVQAGLDVAAVTVDHNLRPESRAEAEGVGHACSRLGIPHHIAFWDGTAARGNVYDAGRRARLALIGDWARANGVGHVLLGHTADDEAETFLMRVSRSAGLDGLSGMRPRFVAEGVVWHRPILSVERQALRDWLRDRDLQWVDDPTNDDTTHERVRARQAMALLAPVGVTAQTVGRTVAHLAAANVALESVVAAWCATHVAEEMGEVGLDAQAFAALQPEIARRVLVKSLMWVAGGDYAPRATKVLDLLARLQSGAGAATLHGCALHRAKGRIWVRREEAAVAGLRICVTSGTVVWDGWCLRGPAESDLVVAALGGAGLRQCPSVRQHRAALRVSPAVWRGDLLVAAPLVGVFAGWQAHNLRGSFKELAFRR